MSTPTPGAADTDLWVEILDQVLVRAARCECQNEREEHV